MPQPILDIEIRPAIRDLLGRFARLEGELADIRREELRALGRKYVAMAQEEAPKDTGAFARTIRYRTTVDTNVLMELRVTTAQPLGGWIVGGTRPHVIVPVRAKALHFVTKAGREVFTKRVMHPGTKPNPFHIRAMDRMRPYVEKSLRKIGLYAVQRLAGEK